MTTEKVLFELQRKGICFVAVLESCGNSALSPSDVLKYISDPEKFDADRCGINLEKYRAWLKAKNDYQCTGTTKRGTHCLNIVFPGGQWSPKTFRKGIDDRCPLHQRGRMKRG